MGLCQKGTVSSHKSIMLEGVSNINFDTPSSVTFATWTQRSCVYRTTQCIFLSTLVVLHHFNMLAIQGTVVFHQIGSHTGVYR